MKISTAIKDKTLAFAVRIVHLSQYIKDEKHEEELSTKLIESGTIIGARIRNADFAQSVEEFATLVNICIAESNQTQSILNILKEKCLIEDLIYNTLSSDLEEILEQLKAIEIN